MPSDAEDDSSDAKEMPSDAEDDPSDAKDDPSDTQDDPSDTQDDPSEAEIQLTIASIGKKYDGVRKLRVLPLPPPKGDKDQSVPLRGIKGVSYCPTLPSDKSQGY